MRRFVVCLSVCHFVLVFFSPFSIAITSLGEERANLSAFRTFVRFVLVWICRFSLPLGVWEGLQFVIVALAGLFSYLFLLTEEQKTQCLKCARELLKTYKGCKSRVISNLLRGDETWMHMFEPQRRADSKQWKRKDQKHPCIAKRTISLKKMLYAIFFNSSGPVVQVPCPSGHTVTGRFYKNSVLKKVKEFYNKKQLSKGWSGVHLLHDNPFSHKSEVVKSFLASEKVKVLNHPPYSPDLSPWYFFLFPRLKKMLSGNKYTSRSSLGSAIYQCLQQIPKEDYLSAFRDWVKRLQKCVSVKGEYFEGL